MSVDQTGLVTGKLAGDAVVQVRDPVSTAAAQTTVKVYGVHPLEYWVLMYGIKCAESVSLSYTMVSADHSLSEDFSFTAGPCTTVGLDSYEPRIQVPVKLRANTKYTFTIIAGGYWLPGYTDALVSFQSTQVGFQVGLRAPGGIPGTYTTQFTTPP